MPPYLKSDVMSDAPSLVGYGASLAGALAGAYMGNVPIISSRGGMIVIPSAVAAYYAAKLGGAKMFATSMKMTGNPAVSIGVLYSLPAIAGGLFSYGASKVF